MKHTNHGYIGYNASGGPRGVMNLNEHYLRTAHPISAGVPISTVLRSTLQAATLVFTNTKLVGGGS